MKNTFDFSSANKYRNLLDRYHQARFALIDYEIANPGLIPFAKAASLVKASGVEDAEVVLNDMIRKNYISTNGESAISCLYPVSCEETRHRVKLEDGREFYAMCAIDAMGCAETFGMSAEVYSYCKDTEDLVYAKITPQGIETLIPSDIYVSFYDSWVEGGFNC